MIAPTAITTEIFRIADGDESSASVPSAIGSGGTGKNGIAEVRNTAIMPSSLNHAGNVNDI